MAKISQELEVHASRLSTVLKANLRTNHVTPDGAETPGSRLTGTKARFCLPTPAQSITLSSKIHARNASSEADAAQSSSHENSLSGAVPQPQRQSSKAWRSEDYFDRAENLGRMPRRRQCSVRGKEQDNARASTSAQNGRECFRIAQARQCRGRAEEKEHNHKVSTELVKFIVADRVVTCAGGWQTGRQWILRPLLAAGYRQWFAL
ncbi:hypothetical protein OPT61_g389 [Boeremia exigua]|uniref:Uncharacterized protein n=1 Tax=Boeremia exigua TaxID=749465 RepID=A0ACC2IU51_9PLEO|nr:hypothetical protein OPT61_g389 [Boeremia exigua]